MKKQRGQSAVEFALISPLIFLLIFAAIYGGAMFIQFLNLSNQARTVARQLAVVDNTTRESYMNKYNNEHLGDFIGLYVVTMRTVKDGEDVVVFINFDHGEFPFGFPPAHFALSYRMRIENDATTASGGDT